MRRASVFDVISSSGEQSPGTALRANTTDHPCQEVRA